MIMNRILSRNMQNILRSSSSTIKFAKLFIMNYPLSYFKARKKQIPPIDEKYTQLQVKKNISIVKNPIFMQILSEAQTIEQLLGLKQQMFSQKSSILPQYLQKLHKMLNKSVYVKYRRDLQFIDEQLNNLSSFQFSSQEFLEIILFYSKFKELQNKDSYISNFGFRKRAASLIANQIHKRQYSLNQVIYFFEILTKLDTTTLLLYMNLTKFFKQQLMKQGEKIKLQQLLTILNVQFLKKNQMIIENVLFDQVLNHLLTYHPILLKNTSLLMRLEVLTVLLCMDIKRTYASNKAEKKLLILKILGELKIALKGEWLRQLLINSPINIQDGGINFYQIMHVVDSMNFVHKNKMQDQSFYNEFKQMLDDIYIIFQKEITSLYQRNDFVDFLKNRQKISIFIRFVFNPLIVQYWIQNQPIKKIVNYLLLKIQTIQQSSLYPIIDLIYTNNNSSSSITILVEILSKINSNLIKNNCVSWCASALLIQKYNQTKGLQLIHQIQKTMNDKKGFSFIFLLHSLIKKHEIEDSKITQSLTKWIKQEIKHLKNESLTSKQFISKLYFTVINFRSTEKVLILSEIFSILFKEVPNFISSILVRIRQIRSQQLLYLLQMIFILKCNQKESPLGHQTKQLFQKLISNDILKYQFLLSCYSEEYPNPKKYNKCFNLLSKQSSFQQNVNILLKYFNDQKYCYFLWDIFIKNYIQKSFNARQACYDLLENIFLKVFIKQNLRKIVIATVFTNHMSSGVIIAPKQRLRNLFEKVIDILLPSQSQIEFHHSCYLQIVFNAISVDILSLEYLTKIINHSLSKGKTLKHTCSLMLIYGATLKCYNCFNSILTLKDVDNQHGYLKYLIKNKCIKLRNIQNLNQQKTQQIDGQIQQSTKKKTRYIYITNKLVVILLKFLRNEVLQLQELIISFIKSNYDYSEWTSIAYSYDPTVFSMKVKIQKQFKEQFNKQMLNKLYFFKKKMLLPEQSYTQLRKKFK